MNEQNEPLFDYPVSRTFREYEAWIFEGIHLPEIEPQEIMYTPPIPEYYLGGRMARIENDFKDMLIDVDSLKKGYHTHKGRGGGSTLYSTVILEENKEDATHK